MTPIDPPTGSGPAHPSSDEADAFENDPTGIRALLQGLPDPGPMPADLVSRIETRLEVERNHRSTSDGPDLAARGDSLVDLAAERSRRRPGRTLVLAGAAAAGLMVTTVAVGQLLGGPGGVGGGTAAYAPASSVTQDRAADDSAAAGTKDQTGADGQDTAGAAADEGEVRGDSAAQGADGAADDDQASGDQAVGDWLPSGSKLFLAASLGEVGDDYGSRLRDAAVAPPTLSPPSQTDSDSLLTLTVAQAISCWTSAPERDWQQAAAAPATQAGDPVVVLLGLDDRGEGLAWVMPEDCTTGPATPLAQTSVQP